MQKIVNVRWQRTIILCKLHHRALMVERDQDVLYLDSVATDSNFGFSNSMENSSERTLLHSITLIDAKTGKSVNGKDLLKGKVVAVVIAPHWLPLPLQQTLSSLSEHIDELKADGKPLELVYVAVDRDEQFISNIKARGQSSIVDERPDLECFDDLCKNTLEGWFVVPFANSEARSSLVDELKTGIFGLAFIGENGETITKDGMPLLMKWGAEGYPFTKERIVQLEKEIEKKISKQSLKSLLVTEARDYLIKNDQSQVKVESLEGKIVGLYFSAHWCGPCRRFTPILSDLYKKMQAEKKDFEVVFVSWDENELEYEEYHKEMPWLAIPFSDKKSQKMLTKYFNVEGIPTLAILDQNGKTQTTDGVEIIKYGVQAYPFTKSRLEELKAEEAQHRASQTLESLLVTETRDFVISHDNKQVKVSELKGKTVGLYFSAHWCPPCRGFTPKLKSVYEQVKDKGGEFEIIFISSDKNEDAFKAYYSEMPWLALPFDDQHSKTTLSTFFDIKGIPSLQIIGADGKNLSDNGRELIGQYGADAFPFTNEHIEEINLKLPKSIHHEGHEHPLLLVADAYDGRPYGCDACEEDGFGWVYHCQACSFDVHPQCVKASKEESPKESPEESPKESPNPEGKEGEWVCEGDVCRRI